MTSRDEKVALIKGHLARWQSGESHKYEFYDLTAKLPARLVAEVADIPVDVVKDRRRYLRQLGAMGKGGEGG